MDERRRPTTGVSRASGQVDELRIFFGPCSTSTRPLSLPPARLWGSPLAALGVAWRCTYRFLKARLHRRAQAHRFSDASWWFAEGWRKVNAREQQIDGEMSMLWPCRAKITWYTRGADGGGGGAVALKHQSVRLLRVWHGGTGKERASRQRYRSSTGSVQ